MIKNEARIMVLVDKNKKKEIKKKLLQDEKTISCFFREKIDEFLEKEKEKVSPFKIFCEINKK